MQSMPNGNGAIIKVLPEAVARHAARHFDRRARGLLERASTEAQASFGDGVYLEQFVHRSSSNRRRRKPA